MVDAVVFFQFCSVAMGQFCGLPETYFDLIGDSFVQEDH
jgi:hypothetical protein